MTDRLTISRVERPGRVALVADREHTFAEVARRAAAIAAGLEGTGRALVVARPDAVTVTTICALLERRVGFALAHARWTERERADAVAKVRPRWILEDGRVTTTDHRAPSTEQAIVFSSGTTGEPKAARLSRDALLAAARAHAEALPFEPRDRWLLSLSPARVGGLSILTRSLFARAAVVIGPARFTPESFARALGSQGVTLASLVPAMLTRLLDAGVDPSSLRAALLGGAACPPALLARARAAGWPALPTYGMTETGAQICTQRLTEMAPRGVGRPLPGTSIRLGRDGAIEVNGPTLMEGYVGEPPRRGWLRTGDLGRWLPSGQLEIVGRADDRIVSGGETVDPLEVEAALRAHPDVRDACVVGDPDDTWGEVVTALIVGDASPDALRAHLEGRLARYKHPRRWVSVGAIPRAASGKPDRAAARSAVGARSPTRSDGVAET